MGDMTMYLEKSKEFTVKGTVTSEFTKLQVNLKKSYFYILMINSWEINIYNSIKI